MYKVSFPVVGMFKYGDRISLMKRSKSCSWNAFLGSVLPSRVNTYDSVSFFCEVIVDVVNVDCFACFAGLCRDGGARHGLRLNR